MVINGREQKGDRGNITGNTLFLDMAAAYLGVFSL